MANKPSLVFCGPVTTVSGYGSHSRDLITSLIQMDKFDISIISINWGETPMDALNPDNEEHKQILDRILKGPMTEQPDIWIQCTIPAEFQRVGRYNIGITAGIETNLYSAEWVDACNRMDLIMVPSKHTKDIFAVSAYDKRDKMTNQLIEAISLKKPVEILHEGVRLDIFNKESVEHGEVYNQLNTINEDFCFLFVGHWLRGDFGQDRKDVSGLIHTFIETFGDTKNPPALVLKTSKGTFSITDKNNVIKSINSIKKASKKKILPNIYLLHGDLNESEMNSLYNHPKIKAFVSFTKGEGYGRPVAEFMTTGKPILISDWSGHKDFVDSAHHVLLKGELKEVHDSAVWDTVINKGSSWFSVDYTDASSKLKDVYKNYNNFVKKSKLSVFSMKTKWSYDKMHERFSDILEKYLPKFATKLKLDLPDLSKLPKLQSLTPLEKDEGDSK
jgi:hypothetical protein